MQPTIEPADAEEAVKIVNDAGIKAEAFSIMPWIAQADTGEKLLFVFFDHGPGVAEMHITCPKESIKRSRELAKAAMGWVFTLGYSKIVTNCPRGTASNMAEKLGMKLSGQDGDKCFYEVTQWA